MSEDTDSSGDAYNQLADGHAVDEPVLVDDSDELESLLNANDVVVVDFFADWCGPCQMMDPVLESLAGNPAPIVKVDVDASQSLASQYGVRSLPTYIIFVDGEPAEQLVGVQDEDEFRETIEGHL